MCDGPALFEAGFELMPPTIAAALDRTGWTFEDVNVVFCHEASRRFIEMGVAQLNGQPSAGPKIWSTVGRFGNTTTFSLPLGMVEAREAGVLVPGSKVLAIAGSSGMSMAALTLVW
jgi:3-oxoacyl-[acyl-carrier-protein] synthase-3